MESENENHSQRGAVFVPNQQFIDFRTYPHLSFISRPPVYVINPSFWPPLPASISRIEKERSLSLLQLMADEGIIPSQDEDAKRKRIVDMLRSIIMKWINTVAYKRRMPRRYTSNASATVLTYGSYGLGVYTPKSDIDALCVGPRFATMGEDFFVVLHNMLASLKEVSEIYCIKDAKVPLIRFKYDGISVDLPYAQLQVMTVPENVDVLDQLFLRDISESSWRALSGVRANKSILQHVPNVKFFQTMLRCVRLWAKRRGVYGHLFGFFGGVHLAVLAAFVCLRRPNIELSAMIAVFFQTFGNWQWPKPVTLHDGILPPTVRTTSLMSIQLPCSPHEFCYSNITGSTFRRIREEFVRGHKLTKDLLRQDFNWNTLFQKFPYPSKYKRFVQIRVSASSQEVLGAWMGWVKSRFRGLLLKLEEVQGMCDPNPSEYFDIGFQNPNVVFYWGLDPDNSSFVDIHSVEEGFRKNLRNGYRGGPPGELTLSIVEASQVPQNPNCQETKACWMKQRGNLMSSQLRLLHVN